MPEEGLEQQEPANQMMSPFKAANLQKTEESALTSNIEAEEPANHPLSRGSGLKSGESSPRSSWLPGQIPMETETAVEPKASDRDVSVNENPILALGGGLDNVETLLDKRDNADGVMSYRSDSARVNISRAGTQSASPREPSRLPKMTIADTQQPANVGGHAPDWPPSPDLLQDCTLHSSPTRLDIHQTGKMSVRIPPQPVAVAPERSNDAAEDENEGEDEDIQAAIALSLVCSTHPGLHCKSGSYLTDTQNTTMAMQGCERHASLASTAF